MCRDCRDLAQSENAAQKPDLGFRVARAMHFEASSMSRCCGMRLPTLALNQKLMMVSLHP